MDELENPIVEEKKLPTFLKILCILTFIAAGLAALMSLLMPLIGPKFLEMMQSAPNYDPDSKESRDAILAMQAGWGYYLLSFALSLASLTGAILMWKLKKIGFHIYVASNVVGFVVPLIILGISFSYVGAFFTVLFIALYSFNYKHLS